MKAINQLIRKEIDKSCKLRVLIKDGDIPKRTSMRLFEDLKEKDKKIIILKKLSNKLKEVEHEKDN